MDLVHPAAFGLPGDQRRREAGGGIGGVAAQRRGDCLTGGSTTGIWCRSGSRRKFPDGRMLDEKSRLDLLRACVVEFDAHLRSMGFCGILTNMYSLL